MGYREPYCDKKGNGDHDDDDDDVQGDVDDVAIENYGDGHLHYPVVDGDADDDEDDKEEEGDDEKCQLRWIKRRGDDVANENDYEGSDHDLIII